MKQADAWLCCYIVGRSCNNQQRLRLWEIHYSYQVSLGFYQFLVRKTWFVFSLPFFFFYLSFFLFSFMPDHFLWQASPLPVQGVWRGKNKTGWIKYVVISQFLYPLPGTYFLALITLLLSVKYFINNILEETGKSESILFHIPEVLANVF